MKKETLQKLQEMLGENKQMVLVKGQLLKPVAVPKKEGGDLYCTFILKQVKSFSDDEYSQGYNNFLCIMPSEIFSRYTREEIAAMKGNEVLAVLEISNIVRNLQGQQGPYTVNNTTYYVHDITQTKTLKEEKQQPNQRLEAI